MSQTIAHRHGTHVRIPLAPIIALAVAAIIAAAVLVLINQPTSTTTRTETAVGAATVALPASVPHRVTIGERRHLIERAQARAHAPAASLAEWRILHNHPEGTTLDNSGSVQFAPPAPAAGASQ